SGLTACRHRRTWRSCSARSPAGLRRWMAAACDCSAGNWICRRRRRPCPFAETKEFIGGISLLECADLDEAIEVAAKCPVSWFQALEIRPFMAGLRLGEKASAFARGEDGDARPYLLMMWMGGTPAAPFDDQTVMDEGEAWRLDLEARGLQVLGNALEGTDTATTVRVRGG